MYSTNLNWARRFPNSANNFDLLLVNAEEVDSTRMEELLTDILEVKHRGLTLSDRASKEFRRWFRQLDSPLDSVAYVLLSNWFMTRSGDRHSSVATRCEALWDALFPCRPIERLSSPEPGKNSRIVPIAFEKFWKRVLDAPGEENANDTRPSEPKGEPSDNEIAKTLRVKFDIQGLHCEVDGSAPAVAGLLRMMGSSEAASFEPGPVRAAREERQDPAQVAPDSLFDVPSEAFRRLLNLPDEQLVSVLKLLHPTFHNLVTDVASAVGKSIGHVQRVLQGERHSGEIDSALAAAFRTRLNEGCKGTVNNQKDLLPQRAADAKPVGTAPDREDLLR